MANDRDCENCVHKVNGACTAWECKFEPKRGITKEEAIEIIECGEISNRWGKDGKGIEEMAIKALKQMPSISEDGTLTVNVEDGSKVSRVLVCGDNHFGGLYYPEQEPCDKCVYSTNEGCQYDDITEAIPPVDPQPKTGYWIEDAGTYYKAIHERGCEPDENTPIFLDDIACSECLAKFSVIDNETERFECCPHCGAKMVEPQESEEV